MGFVYGRAAERGIRLAGEKINAGGGVSVGGVRRPFTLMGVYGWIRFDPRSHQVISARHPREGAEGTIFQWLNGNRIAVFPSSIATREVRLPPGLKRR